MLTKKSLPVGTLFMVLVILLALLGVGYALWSDTLVITGTVETGNVDMAFSPCTTNDEGVDPGYEKDVASCGCEPSDGDLSDGTDDTGPDALTISIENGYPSYSCEVSYDMTNMGSIPVHLYSVTEDYDPSALEYTQECVDESGDPVGIGYQLHTGEHVYCTIGLHVLQEAEEGGTYELTKEYLWGQYNEGPIYVLSDLLNYNGSGGWGGWSCPEGTIVVDGGYLPATADVAVSMKWAPGASYDGTSYPNTPWGGYTYHSGWVPPEEGWIVRDGGLPGSPITNVPDHIFLWCTP
jgi:predicted ribosomally synthesized peptide with SipW-like signal peptide